MDQSQIFQDSTSPPKQQQAYKKIKVLGEGAMGKAYLVQSNVDHKQYVMKRINIGHLSPQQQQIAMRESQLHSLVHHPNIIEFKQIYHTTKDKLCIIMEYAENGDLDQFIQQQNGKLLPQETILHYFSQICIGLREIHAKKIIHRDIKAANIFLSKDRTVKIGDFGISKVIDQTVQASKSFVGTPYYLSPQMVEGKPYSTKADIWALGVLFYNMCAQKLPFQAGSLPLLALRILRGSYPPLTGPYSKDLKSLVSSMLQVDAKKRPTVVQILMKPILLKYIPRQQMEKIQALKQKPKMPKNPTTPNLMNNIVTGQTINTVKPAKKSAKPKISQEQKKLKQKQLKQQKKKKRDEQIKQMRDDIKRKRLQAQKQKLGSTKTIQTQNGQISQKIPSKKAIPIVQKSPQIPKNELQQQKQPIQKPWKTKNKGSKKQVQVQILLPPIKSKQPPKKQQQITPSIDFQIQIKQFGKKPSASTSHLYEKSQTQNTQNENEKNGNQLQQEQQQISQQLQSEEENEQEEDDFKQMLNQVNYAQQLAQGLVPKGGKKIELYEQSQNFDQDDDVKIPKRNLNTPSIPEMNTMEEQSWKFINNSQNLEQGRQIVQDALGQQKFMKAYVILNQHLDSSQQKKMRGEQLDDYTFNREVLRKKLDFLTDKQFNDYIVLMYTLVIIEIEQMKKNLDD